MTDLIVNGTITEGDKNILEALLHPSAVVGTLFPMSTDAVDLLSNLALCCKASAALERSQRKISPVVGRILMVIQENPEVYKNEGHRTFEDFINNHVMGNLHFSRASAYESMRLVSRMPNLTLAKWEELGIGRLRVLAKFTREGESFFPKYLAKAEESESTDAFEKWAIEQSFIARGEMKKKPLIIEVTQDAKTHFKQFVSDPRIQAVVGVADAGVILEAMMQEASASWLAEENPAPHVIVHEVDKEGPVGVATSLSWYCPECKLEGEVAIKAGGESLNDIRDQIGYDHRYICPDCAGAAGAMVIRGIA